MGDAEISAKLAAIREQKDCQLWDCPLVSPEFISIPPHRVGIAHLMFRPRFLLADPVGCGKTPQVLVAFAQLKYKRPNLRMIAVTIDSAQYQFAEEALRLTNTLTVEVLGLAGESDRDTEHVSRLLSNSRLGATDLPKKKRRTFAKPIELRTYQYAHSTADILVTTWDQMVRDKDTLLASRWLEDTILVFDEVAEKARNWSQKTFHPAARSLALKGLYSWGLTATPLTRRIDDLFSIYEVIRPGTFGAYNEFRLAYYELELRRLRLRSGKVKRFYEPALDEHKRPILKNIEQLQRIIRPYYLKRRAEEINQYLPKLSRPKVIDVEMGPEQRAFYETVIDRWFHPHREVKATSRLEQIAALNYAQMASDAPEALGIDAPSAKLDAFVRFVREEAVDDKVIVFTKYKEVLKCIIRRLDREGIGMVSISGDLDKMARQAAKERFWSDAATKVMGITTAGGQALNLQVARLVVFFDLPWTWGSFVQILGRARRMGASFPQVLPVLLINTNSIDEKTVHVLSTEKSLVDNVLGLDADEKLQFTSDDESLLLNELPLVNDVVNTDAAAVADADVVDLFAAVRRR